jgi:uncharacterized protein (TIGR02466 family)
VNINNLFPTAVGFSKLGRDLTQQELDFIIGQVRYPNEGNTTSENRKLLKSVELTEIREFIEDAMLEYFKSVHAPKFDVTPYITQSWSNYTEPGQYHHKHAHPNSIISGVFYPQADRESDKIYFYKDGYERIKLPAAEYNPHNSESWWFETGTGDLIIFPSHLTHMVQTKQGDGTRISISFNTFLKGYIGSDESLTGLHLGEE